MFWWWQHWEKIYNVKIKTSKKQNSEIHGIERKRKKKNEKNFKQDFNYDFKKLFSKFGIQKQKLKSAAEQRKKWKTLA